MKKTMSPAAIMKRIKTIEQKKESILRNEAATSSYKQIGDEQPEICSYDFKGTRVAVGDLDKEVCALKFALSRSNVMRKLDGWSFTPCEALVLLAQCNKELGVVTRLANNQQKSQDIFSFRRDGGNRMVYDCANYDVEEAKKYRDDLQNDIYELQMALDQYNLTAKVEVDLPE